MFSPCTQQLSLHEQLTTELARIDRQEENLIDLAATASDTSDNARIRTRITELQTRREQFKTPLEDTGERLQQGADVLTIQLDPLEHPDELYRRLPGSGRHQLNQAIVEQLLVDLDPEDPEDPEDPDVTIAGQNQTDPVHDLMTAAHHKQASTSPKRDRGTVIDGPSVAFSAGRMEHDTCSNKAPAVELRGRNSNLLPWSEGVKQIGKISESVTKGHRVPSRRTSDFLRCDGSAPAGRPGPETTPFLYSEFNLPRR